MTKPRTRATVTFALAAAIASGCAGAGSAVSPSPAGGPSDPAAPIHFSESAPSPRAVQPDGSIPLEDALDLIPGEELLWVWTGDSVTGVTPDSLEPSITVNLDFEFGGMVEANGVLWFADFEGGSLHRYNLQQGAWLEDVEVMAHPNRIAAHAGSVWVGNGHGRWLSRIDSEQGTVVQTWEPLTEQPSRGEVPGDAFWGTSADSFEVFAIDPATDELAAELPVGFSPCAAQVVDAHVWVLRCIETGENPAVHVFAVGDEPGAAVPTPGWLGRIAAVDNRLWIPLYDVDHPDDGAALLLALDRASLGTADAITIGEPIFDAVAAFDALWLTTPTGLARLSGEALSEP